MWKGIETLMKREAEGGGVAVWWRGVGGWGGMDCSFKEEAFELVENDKTCLVIQVIY